MTTAEHLDTIDRLRAQVFPPEPVWSGRHSSGPGYHLVQLVETRDFWEDDGSGRIEAADQISAEYGALEQALTDRWGKPQVFTLEGAMHRGLDGEEIPQPWEELSNSTDHVHLWRAEDRWLVAYVAYGEAEDPFRLMAGVTVVDPP
ncbi:hypothetical protein AB0N28_12275 [Streptomyces sp. NPDC051130]|uniref:hypothetical protein n=1 Tax=Streptomyces sp. NPDC051130 TaxID=3157223 RepID=UPI00343B6F5A